MARNKNSPALFEVIRNAQQKQKEQADRQRQQALAAEIHAHSPAAGLLMQPIYWFKGKLAHEAANDQTETAVEKPTPVMREVPKPRQEIKRTPPQPPAVSAAPEVQPVVPSVTVDAPPAVLPVVEKPVIDVAPPAPQAAPAYTPAPTSAAAEAARQVREELFAAQEAPAAEPSFHAPDYDKPYAAPYAATAFDGDDEPAAARGFQFTYTSAAVAAFAIVVAFGLAYVIGSHNRNNQLATANANETAVARPDVLHVGPAVTPKPVVKEPDADEVVVDNSRANVSNTNDVSLAGIGKPIPVPTDVKRVVGMHYVVLQSFPSDYDAKELVKYLAQNGVAATSERPLPGYAPRWSSVITVRGFDHVKNNPALEAYTNALTGVLKKYAAEQGGLKKNFKLDLYKWKTAAK